MSSDPEVNETITASALPTRSRHIREPLGVLAALAVLAIAVSAAIGERSAPAQLGIGESVASASSNFLAQIASGLPFGYAFAAGMVAAVNPCGFALLPGYLGLYLGTERSAEQLPRRLLRAAGIALVVSASFVVLFGAAGAVVAASSSGIARLFPWIGLAVGVALIAAGASALVGAGLHLNLGDRLGDRAGDNARRGGVVGYAAYGVAYAAASLGCTPPIFLSRDRSRHDGRRSRPRVVPVRALRPGHGTCAVSPDPGRRRWSVMEPSAAFGGLALTCSRWAQ